MLSESCECFLSHVSAQVSLHKSCHLYQDSLAPKGTDKNYQHLSPEDTSAETGGGQSMGSGAGSQSSCPRSSQDLCLSVAEGGNTPGWEHPRVATEGRALAQQWQGISFFSS